MARHPYRHPSGWISQEQLESLNTTPRGWFEVGSALYRSAVVVAPVGADPDGTTVLFIGEGAARVVGSEEHNRALLHRVAGMLFGMAVEAWCKGLYLEGMVGAGPVEELFKTHDLRKLTDWAGITPFLTEDDLYYLDLLTSLTIGSGRFPAPKSVKDHCFWVDVAVEETRWNSLRAAIWKRALELRH